jgi:general secretion pathway protein I
VTRRVKSKKQNGFSLLEAIVALTLLAVAGLALFSWINASFDGIARADAAQARAQAQSNAIAYIQTINPMARPSGEAKLGSLSINWAAKEIAPKVKPSVDSPDGTGNFIVALYDIEVTMTDLPRIPAFTIRVSQLGFERFTKTEKQ